MDHIIFSSGGVRGLMVFQHRYVWQKRRKWQRKQRKKVHEDEIKTKRTCCPGSEEKKREGQYPPNQILVMDQVIWGLGSCTLK